MEDGLVINGEFVGHVLREDVMIGLPNNLPERGETTMLDESMVSQKKPSVFVLCEEENVWYMFEQPMEFASVAVFSQNRLMNLHGEKVLILC